MIRPNLNDGSSQSHYDNEMSETFLVNELEEALTQKERLTRECDAILKLHEVRYRAATNFDDYKNWNCYIIGYPGTPYDDGIFFFRIEFDEKGYPQKAPRVFFETRIDHPCILVDGEVRFWDEWWNSKMQALDVFKQLDKLMIDFNLFVLQYEWGNVDKGNTLLDERRSRASIFTKRYAAYK